MELTYRGRNYEKHLTHLQQEVMPGEVADKYVGKYRGNQWAYEYPRHIPMPATDAQLKYRGISYNPASAVDRISGHQHSENTPSNGEMVIKNSKTDPKVGQIHRANICRNLDRRWLIAQAEGNEDLMRLLEKEFQQVAC